MRRLNYNFTVDLSSVVGVTRTLLQAVKKEIILVDIQYKQTIVWKSISFKDTRQQTGKRQTKSAQFEQHHCLEWTGDTGYFEGSKQQRREEWSMTIHNAVNLQIDED